jgi:phytoene dehydrogenase-like protein
LLTFEGYSIDRNLLLVGDGLPGLPAAALVAQARRSVAVFEQAAKVTGRAATQVSRGVSFNLGPHALYFLGHTFKLLRKLGVLLTARLPSLGQSRLLTENGHTPPCPAALHLRCNPPLHRPAQGKR